MPGAQARGPSPFLVPFSLLPLLWLACGDPGPGPQSLTVRDSAGVRIVETSLPTTDLPAELVASIGEIDGEDVYQLFQVSDASRLRDGRIAVANGGTREVRIYDAKGVHLKTLGGPGPGPEEYEYPMRVRQTAEGRIMVQDRHDRVYYDSEGEYIERLVLDSGDWWNRFGPIGFPEPTYWSADGGLVAAVSERRTEPPRGGPPFRPVQIWIRADADLSRIDTLGAFGGIEQQYVDVSGRPSSVILLFAAETSSALRADGAVYVADGAEPAVHRFEPDGGHTITRWNAEPDEISDEEVERERARWLGFMPEERRARYEAELAAADTPDHKPFTAGVQPIRGGGFWVRITTGEVDGPSTWAAFDADGTPTGLASLPAYFRLTDAGPGYVVGIQFDPDTLVERVRLFRIGEPTEAWTDR